VGVLRRRPCAPVLLLLVLGAGPAQAEEPRDDAEPDKTDQTPLQRALGGAETPPSNVYPILDADVFTYFDLASYDTPLKQQAYRKSDEYKARADELATERKRVLSRSFYVELEPELGAYDLRKRRFSVAIGVNVVGAPIEGKPAKTREPFVFENLPTRLAPLGGGGEFGIPGGLQEFLDLLMAEQKALSVEQAGAAARVYIVFRMLRTKTYGYRVLSVSQGWFGMTGRFVSTKVEKILVGNKETGLLYLERRL
jgi:hypothetical protein